MMDAWDEQRIRFGDPVRAQRLLTRFEEVEREHMKRNMEQGGMMPTATNLTAPKSTYDPMSVSTSSISKNYPLEDLSPLPLRLEDLEDLPRIPSHLNHVPSKLYYGDEYKTGSQYENETGSEYETDTDSDDDPYTSASRRAFTTAIQQSHTTAVQDRIPSDMWNEIFSFNKPSLDHQSHKRLSTRYKKFKRDNKKIPQASGDMERDLRWIQNNMKGRFLMGWDARDRRGARLVGDWGGDYEDNMDKPYAKGKDKANFYITGTRRNPTNDDERRLKVFYDKGYTKEMMREAFWRLPIEAREDWFEDYNINEEDIEDGISDSDDDWELE